MGIVYTLSAVTSGDSVTILVDRTTTVGALQRVGIPVGLSKSLFKNNAGDAVDGICHGGI